MFRHHSIALQVVLCVVFTMPGHASEQPDASQRSSVDATGCLTCETEQAIRALLAKDIAQALAEGDQAKFEALVEMAQQVAFQQNPQIAFSRSSNVPKIPVQVLDAPQVNNNSGASGNRGKTKEEVVRIKGKETHKLTSEEVQVREQKQAEIARQRFFITLGATSPSPFRLTRFTDEQRASFETWPPPGVAEVLEPGQTVDFYIEEDSTVSGYLEMGYRDRWAWRIEEAYDPCAWKNRIPFGKKDEALAGVFSNWLNCIDKDFRIGFALGDEKASASTLLGSGEVGVSLQLGIPLLTVGENYRQSINLEFLNEITTDRKFQDINDRSGIGFSYNLGFDGPSIFTGDDDPGNRPYEFSLQYLEGSIDGPALIQEVGIGSVLIDGNNRGLVVTENGNPLFKSSSNTYHYGIDLQIPYGDNGYLSFAGAFVTGSVDPNPWSIQFGLTLPAAEIFKIFSPLAGNSANKAGEAN